MSVFNINKYATGLIPSGQSNLYPEYRANKEPDKDKEKDFFELAKETLKKLIPVAVSLGAIFMVFGPRGRGDDDQGSAPEKLTPEDIANIRAKWTRAQEIHRDAGQLDVGERRLELLRQSYDLFKEVFERVKPYAHVKELESVHWMSEQGVYRVGGLLNKEKPIVAAQTAEAKAHATETEDKHTMAAVPGAAPAPTPETMFFDGTIGSRVESTPEPKPEPQKRSLPPGALRRAPMRLTLKSRRQSPTVSLSDRVTDQAQVGIPAVTEADAAPPTPQPQPQPQPRPEPQPQPEPQPAVTVPSLGTVFRKAEPKFAIAAPVPAPTPTPAPVPASQAPTTKFPKPRLVQPAAPQADYTMQLQKFTRKQLMRLALIGGDELVQVINEAREGLARDLDNIRVAFTAEQIRLQTFGAHVAQQVENAQNLEKWIDHLTGLHNELSGIIAEIKKEEPEMRAAVDAQVAAKDSIINDFQGEIEGIVAGGRQAWEAIAEQVENERRAQWGQDVQARFNDFDSILAKLHEKAKNVGATIDEQVRGVVRVATQETEGRLSTLKTALERAGPASRDQIRSAVEKAQEALNTLIEQLKELKNGAQAESEKALSVYQDLTENLDQRRQKEEEVHAARVEELQELVEQISRSARGAAEAAASQAKGPLETWAKETAPRVVYAKLQEKFLKPWLKKQTETIRRWEGTAEGQETKLSEMLAQLGTNESEYERKHERMLGELEAERQSVGQLSQEKLSDLRAKVAASLDDYKRQVARFDVGHLKQEEKAWDERFGQRIEAYDKHRESVDNEIAGKVLGIETRLATVEQRLIQADRESEARRKQAKEDYELARSISLFTEQTLLSIQWMFHMAGRADDYADRVLNKLAAAGLAINISADEKETSESEYASRVRQWIEEHVNALREARKNADVAAAALEAGIPKVSGKSDLQSLREKLGLGNGSRAAVESGAQGVVIEDDGLATAAAVEKLAEGRPAEAKPAEVEPKKSPPPIPADASKKGRTVFGTGALAEPTTTPPPPPPPQPEIARFTDDNVRQEVLTALGQRISKYDVLKGGRRVGGAYASTSYPKFIEDMLIAISKHSTGIGDDEKYEQVVGALFAPKDQTEPSAWDGYVNYVHNLANLKTKTDLPEFVDAYYMATRFESAMGIEAQGAIAAAMMLAWARTYAAYNDKVDLAEMISLPQDDTSLLELARADAASLYNDIAWYLDIAKNLSNMSQVAQTHLNVEGWDAEYIYEVNKKEIDAMITEFKTRAAKAAEIMLGEEGLVNSLAQSMGMGAVELMEALHNVARDAEVSKPADKGRTILPVDLMDTAAIMDAGIFSAALGELRNASFDDATFELWHGAIRSIALTVDQLFERPKRTQIEYSPVSRMLQAIAVELGLLGAGGIDLKGFADIINARLPQSGQSFKLARLSRIIGTASMSHEGTYVGERLSNDEVISLGQSLGGLAEIVIDGEHRETLAEDIKAMASLVYAFDGMQRDRIKGKKKPLTAAMYRKKTTRKIVKQQLGTNVGGKYDCGSEAWMRALNRLDAAVDRSPTKPSGGGSGGGGAPKKQVTGYLGRNAVKSQEAIAPTVLAIDNSATGGAIRDPLAPSNSVINRGVQNAPAFSTRFMASGRAVFQARR